MQEARMGASIRIVLIATVIAGCGPSGSGADAGTDDRDARAWMRRDAGPSRDGGAIADGEHPFIYLNDDNLARLRAAANAGTPASTRFIEIVDAQIEGGDIYAFEPWYAALARWARNDDRYCEYAVAQTEAFVASEEMLIAETHRAGVAGDSYLEVGPHIGNVALVYDWCFDLLSDAQRTRWVAYANQAVFNVWNPGEASWGGVAQEWNGWSIDNPANNYYYSFLRATMMLALATRGENDRAEEWRAIFRDEKIAAQLVPLFDRDLGGGGSREGTGYGTSLGRLFELYDFWEASTGERIADLTYHTHSSLAHFLHTVVPTGEYLVPTGDHARDSTAAFFDYHRLYLLALTHLYASEDPPLAAVARGFLRNGPLPRMEHAFMAVYDFLYDDPSAPEAPLSELHPAYHGSGTGQFYFRSSWEADATLLHAIGGPFTESHAHEDQGSFVVFRNQWLADDSNVRSHSGIEQDPELHNLVRLVRAGETLHQRRERDPSRAIGMLDRSSFAWVAIDSAPVYADEGVREIRRDIVFLKPRAIVILDRVDVASDVSAIWQLNTPGPASIDGETATIDGESAVLRVLRVLPDVDPALVDWNADERDITGGYRIELRAATGPATFLTVLSIDGAVRSADPFGALGVEIELDDDGVVTIDFEAGVVTIDGASTTLAPSLAELPVFAR
jgi:hypothetical protein